MQLINYKKFIIKSKLLYFKFLIILKKLFEILKYIF